MSPLKVIFLLTLIAFSSNDSIERNFINILKSFENGHLSNRDIITFMEYTSKKNHLIFPDHLGKNKVAFKNHLVAIKHNNGFIEDQYNYQDIVYGVKPLSYNGNQLIALYNALHYLTKKDDIDFPSIIEELEIQGIYIDGYFGASPISVENYFQKNGFNTRSSYYKKDYDEIGNSADAAILTVYISANDNFQKVHTVAVTKENGKFYIHNHGANSSKTAYNSISDIINKIISGKDKFMYLTGIYKK